jgi:hypothetical protein
VKACKEANRRIVRPLIDAIKDRPCADCGLRFPPICMDFDHRDPTTKLENVSILYGNGAAWERIRAEIDKCDVVCANCHRIRTWPVAQG